VIPRGTALDTNTVLNHINDVFGTKAGVTSWTTDLAIARRFAQGPGGVIIEVNLCDVAAKIYPRPVMAPDRGESEVLLIGKIQGVPRLVR
jgi:hypothetical protein